MKQYQIMNKKVSSTARAMNRYQHQQLSKRLQYQDKLRRKAENVNLVSDISENEIYALLGQLQTSPLDHAVPSQVTTFNSHSVNFKPLFILILLACSVTPANASLLPILLAGGGMLSVSGNSEVANNQGHPEHLGKGPTFNGLETVVIHEDKIKCSKKSLGIVKGKQCTIGDKEYMLKEIAEHKGDEDKKDPKCTDGCIKTNPMRTLYFNEFLKLISDKFVTPGVKLFHQTSPNSAHCTKYLGSEFVAEFKQAVKAIEGPEIYQLFLAGKISIRAELEKKVGEENFQNLIIASTIVPDLIPSFGNWGYDDQKNLIIVDIDHPTYQLKHYVNQCIKTITKISTQFGIGLSIEDIKAMRSAYLSLKTKDLPKVHPTIDFNDQLFDQLMDIYIKVCDQVIKEMGNVSGQSLMINELFKSLMTDEYWAIPEPKASINMHSI